jgi:hypothetical protein
LHASGFGAAVSSHLVDTSWVSRGEGPGKAAQTGAAELGLELRSPYLPAQISRTDIAAMPVETSRHVSCRTAGANPEHLGAGGPLPSILLCPRGSVSFI